MDLEFVLIKTFVDQHMAKEAKVYLESHNIKVILRNADLKGVPPYQTANAGGTAVLVLKADEKKARELIKNL